MVIDTKRHRIEYNGINCDNELEFTIYPPLDAGINSTPFTATISMNDVKYIVRLAMMEG